MTTDLLEAFAVLLAFVMGFWNGWAWREIIAHRRHGDVVGGVTGQLDKEE